MWACHFTVLFLLLISMFKCGFSIKEKKTNNHNGDDRENSFALFAGEESPVSIIAKLD